MAEILGADGRTVDLTGYRVEGPDGRIGRVDRHSDFVDERHLVVDTGFWVFGREVMVPMTAVTAVDEERRTVSLSLSHAEIDRLYRAETSG
ncbi:hypothetical protein [Kitasatospora sp. NPDC058218]|uniref:hypothetical protein n=1 Tax=Kitasatospora sp. NPDC058218 TaxID=3346385 RepID=UPI0036D82462